MRSSLAGRCALFFVIVVAISAACFAQVGISITIGPPPLPVYEQPPCPEEGYIWTPGTGLTITMQPLATGYPARGCSLRTWLLVDTRLLGK